MNNEAVVCVKCGVPTGKGDGFCPVCGAQTHPDAVVCVSCGAPLVKEEAKVGNKSKLAAGLLGIFLGCWGVHNFYLKYTGKAIAQLSLGTVGGIFSCGVGIIVSAIWGFIEGIMILCDKINVDANGNKLKD